MRLSRGRGAVGVGQASRTSFCTCGDGHLQRRVSHLEGGELQPVFGPRQTAFLRQTIVERRGRKGRDLSENRQYRRPVANLLQGALGDAGGIIIQAENKGSDGVDVAPRQPLQHAAYSRGLVEALVDAGEIRRDRATPCR